MGPTISTPNLLMGKLSFLPQGQKSKYQSWDLNLDSLER